MTNIAIRKTTLPSTIPDLAKFLLIGNEQLKLYQSKVKAIEKLHLAKAVKDQAVEDGQRMGTALLFAEAKMGQLLKDLPSQRGSQTGKKGREPILPEGITHKQSHFAQKLANNQDLIEETIIEAEKYEDIPTKRAVFNKIREREISIKKQKSREIILPQNKYRVIYADPPWQFNNAGLSESAQSHYPTMSTEKICEMPVNDLCTEGTVLFLWATNAMLIDALKVVDMWGFVYKTNFVWTKDKGPSIGWFNISRHELLLLATKKDNPHPLEKFNSIIRQETSKHSQKPLIVYSMIEKMYGGPYIELFARNKKDNWESWGNDIP